MLVKLLKFVIGLALAPAVAGEIWTLYDLARAVLPAGEWTQAWFLSLGAGVLTWFIVYFFMPRTMWLYVLGHELTHAFAAMMAGGKVSSFQVTEKGGHVITDRVNWWITLSPYFVPLYALIWSALWLTIDFYHPLRAYQPILYFGIGLFWCFHLTFTTSMLHLRQSDLSSQGFVFSFVVILLINLVFFLIVFALLAHGQPFADTALLLWHRVEQAYSITGQQIASLAAWAWQWATNLK